jgi:hypothetical protein
MAAQDHRDCPARKAPDESWDEFYARRRIYQAYIRLSAPRRWVPAGCVCRACGQYWPERPRRT